MKCVIDCFSILSSDRYNATTSHPSHHDLEPLDLQQKKHLNRVCNLATQNCGVTSFPQPSMQLGHIPTMGNILQLMLHSKKTNHRDRALNARLACHFFPPIKTWGGAAPSIRSSVPFYEKLIAPLGTGIISPASSSPNPSPVSSPTPQKSRRDRGHRRRRRPEGRRTPHCALLRHGHLPFLIQALVSSSSSSASYVKYLKIIHQCRLAFSRQIVMFYMRSSEAAGSAQ